MGDVFGPHLLDVAERLLDVVLGCLPFDGPVLGPRHENLVLGSQRGDVVRVVFVEQYGHLLDREVVGDVTCENAQPLGLLDQRCDRGGCLARSAPARRTDFGDGREHRYLLS